jgi:5-methylcytosine-specific restriction enzyme MrcB-like protein
MSERGLLIRNAAPEWLSGHASDLGDILAIDDFFAEGRDGTGRKTRVPWVRFGSRSLSPRATEGFYVVYLFDALGGAVYLSLNQGTTDFRAGEFVPKPRKVITERADWARSVLAPWLNSLNNATVQIDLHDPHLGAGYELGNVAAVPYDLGAIPGDASLYADARVFAEGLGMLYQEHAHRPIPQERPELREAEEAADRASGSKRSASRAGFRTNAREIKAIEAHAVAFARAYYETGGFLVKELGKPFDLEVKKQDMVLTVEVKGTTSDGSGVPLTAGEVRHHAEAFPNNALIVVRNIALHRDGTSPTASGGRLYELRGWDIDVNSLRVISYAYDIPAEMYEHQGISSESLL